MIIDGHTHIFPDSIAKRALDTLIGNTKGQIVANTDGTWNDLVRSMDDAGVDFSIVLPIATHPRQGAGILRWIEDVMPRTSRLIFFCSVHPEDPNLKELIKRAKDLGLQGIKIHPVYQNFAVDSKEGYRLYEESLKNDLVLYFHAGLDIGIPESDYSSVERFSRMLKSFDGCKIVLAHAGGYGDWEKVLNLLNDRKCYFDTAWVLEAMKQNDHAKELYRRNEDRFIFGTDSPWREQKRYVELVRDSDVLTEEQKQKLFYENMQRLINIPETRDLLVSR